MQTNHKTLAQPVTLSGVGLHNGMPVTMTLHPAPADFGIQFVRTDIQSGDNHIPARYDRVVDSRLCTVLANPAGVTVGTIEHLMAALRGAEVTNARIELDAPEVPAMDGSSAEFLAAIDRAGVVAQPKPIQFIRVLETVRVVDGDKSAELNPADRASFSGSIDFSHQTIGQQNYRVELLNGNFRHEIARARTFGLYEEVAMMRSAGLALGGSLDNAIVVDKNGVMNPDGLRYHDEFIRHKLLDAIGDLYLAGMPVLAAYHGNKASHSLNNALVRALFATPASWRIEQTQI
jgi:UDP-3-O-[3-hydroxymyristoyl] N-acetylglucosamine deacetylase